MGIYNYIKMISNISEYRQKKVDQLVKNLERCSKIVSNIEKIDSYIIQQTGGDDALIQQLTQELTARKAKIMTPDASKKVISAEQLNKLQNTMRKVGELIKAVSMLVHTKATDYATADLPSIDKSVLAESPVEMRQKFNTLNSEGKYAEAEAIRQSMVASYNVKVPSYYESMLKTARDTKAPNNKIAGELEKLADSTTGNKNLETIRNEILKEYYRLKSDKKEVASPVKKETTSPVKKETTSPVKKGTTSPVKKETTSPKKEVASPKKEVASPKKEVASPKKETTSPVKKETKAV